MGKPAYWQRMVIDFPIYHDEVEEYYQKEWKDITKAERKKFYMMKLEGMEDAHEWFYQIGSAAHSRSAIFSPTGIKLADMRSEMDREAFP